MEENPVNLNRVFTGLNDSADHWRGSCCSRGHVIAAILGLVRAGFRILHPGGESLNFSFSYHTLQRPA